MKRTRITLLTLLLILLLCACSSKTNTSNVSESISQGASVISKETTSEGKTITTLADGTVIEKASDGSTIEKYSDGTTKEIQANGTVIETAIDGTIIETKIDGTVILTKADGSQIETAPDGSTKEIQAAPEVPTEATVATVATPIVDAPTEAGGTTPIVVPPTDAAVATPIVVPPTQAAVATSDPVPAPAPTNNIYELTSAETFLQQVSWSAINMNTSQNVYDQLCVIGDAFANGSYTQTQAAEQIKRIKDSIRPEWWIFESDAKTLSAPGKLDCSTTALKQALIQEISNDATLRGDNKYSKVFYNPNTDTTIIYYVTVSGTIVHN